mmetsp:Transcript_61916/g.122473  ORF Transcript_61916/g.122473 Transcript_61916/m.122473 type:complete len:99 (+) Transcript_61916:1936-2232(+)
MRIQEIQTTKHHADADRNALPVFLNQVRGSSGKLCKMTYRRTTLCKAITATARQGNMGKIIDALMQAKPGAAILGAALPTPPSFQSMTVATKANAEAT